MTEVLNGSPADSVLLGTAGWGQKVSKEVAYEILRNFYARGYRWVDTATNYPIDQNPENYGTTVNWLCDFYRDFPGLRVFIKAGSATNRGEPTQLVNASYFALISEILINRLGDAFGGLGVHWDNGTEILDRTAIVDLFSDIHQRGFAIGMSGISKPETYSSISTAKSLPWIYQVNLSPIRAEQIVYNLSQVRSHFPKAKIYGYNLLGGIAGKGLLNEGDRFTGLKKAINARSEAGTGEILEQVVSTAKLLNIDGLVIGPSSVDQCLEWCATLDKVVQP